MARKLSSLLCLVYNLIRHKISTGYLLIIHLALILATKFNYKYRSKNNLVFYINVTT